MRKNTKIANHLHDTLFPAVIGNFIHYTVWGETAYPFTNLNGATVEVWEWISNFSLYFTECVITYPCWDWSKSVSVKWAACRSTIGRGCALLSRRRLTNSSFTTTQYCFGGHIQTISLEKGCLQEVQIRHICGFFCKHDLNFITSWINNRLSCMWYKLLIHSQPSTV